MADDPNAGGGDTGAGNEGGDGGGDAPKFITQEDFSKELNKAITNHVGRMETRLTKTLGATVGASITEALAALSKKPDDAPENKGDAKPDGKQVLMERKLQKLTEDLETSNAARELEAGKRKDEGLRGDVVSALGDLNMTGQRLRGATAMLYAEGRVYIGEDGSHLFKDADGIEFPLSDGVKAWSGSEEAKLYMPPSNVRGSGDKGGGKPPAVFKDNDPLNVALQNAIEGVEKFVVNR